MPARTQPSRDTVKRMRAQGTRDTKCEMAIRRLLHAAGLRYRVDSYPLKGLNRKADVVFRPAKTAVFIDGCFWHGCELHPRPSKTNSEWWARKIEGNQKRDIDTDRRLRDAEWFVIRVWEHDSPAVAASRIQSVVEARRQQVK